ncbi:MAG: ribonuclease P protein component [Candidatus Marinimicrobia bacterium]|nr:ribonuclease P protein component [Candidatus Neomarinimicrobiota bacterium]
MIQRLTRARQLTRKKEFDRVFTDGRKVVHGRMVLRLVPAPHPRLGCTVSRKYGNSVRRHQYKRRVRAAFHQYYHQLPTADMVLSALPGKGFITYEEIDAVFAGLKAHDQTAG